MTRFYLSMLVILIAVACTGSALERASPAGSTPGAPSSMAAITPAVATDALPKDPDDPAIWFNSRNPENSLLLGTMKVAAPDGALAVFGLDGKLRHLLKGRIARTTWTSSTGSISMPRRPTSRC